MGETLVFASTDEGAQSAMLMIKGGQLEHPRLQEMLSVWPAIHSAVAFDCWIANGDRHHGNLLLKDGGIFLVDHSHAFTGSAWNAASLAKDPAVRNKLAISIRATINDDPMFQSFMNKVDQCQSLIAAVDLSKEFLAAHTNGLTNADDLTALLSYLTNRRAKISALVAAELGRPRLT
ncbi:MAG: hypothetical protein C0484_03415 [Rhodospirillum sp.]|nr:hypothetical protein [Rhodospirillum sp.]